MSLLSPFSALLAAAIAVPLLLLLYFLKLRRRRLRMASTLLWQKSFEDLQANVPFQRLRFSTLLLLQLLLLALLLLALADPVFQSEARPASRLILLIDRSASMSAADADAGSQTRLDAAKAAAKDIVERLGRSSGANQVMLITFGAQAQMALGYESRREILVEAIDAIEPTDEEADLAAALKLVGVFAARGEEDEGRDPEVVLISDGTVAPPDDAAGFSLRGGNFRFVRVGPEDDDSVRNVGIVSLSARRDYSDPTQAIVFVRLLNAGPAPVQTLLTLRVDDEPGAMKQVRIGAATRDEEGLALAPGEATASFAIDLPGGAVLSVRHNTRDALSADDTAAVVLPPPARPRIVLVCEGAEPDVFLHELLQAQEPQSLRQMSAAAFETVDPADLDQGRLYDLVVFDRVAAQRLPGVPTLTFGAVPAGIGVSEPESEEGHRILSWNRQHPLMRHVSLDSVVYARFGSLVLPPGATALATGPAGPVIAVLAVRNQQHVVVGFEPAWSTWPVDVSMLVFMQNVLDYLRPPRLGRTSLAVRPGEMTVARVRGDADEIVITGPREATIPVTAGSLATLPALRRVGLYTADGLDPPHDRLAVSVLSEVESDIRGRAELVVNAESAPAGGAAAAAPRAVWPWFIAAALAILVLEWIAYCRLSRV